MPAARTPSRQRTPETSRTATRRAPRARKVEGGELVALDAEPRRNGAAKHGARAKGGKGRGKAAGKAGKKGGAKRAKKPALTARTADPMELYQLAVQSPDVDAKFLATTFKKLRGREARHLREDFCGTAYLAAAWLRRHRENTVEGFDIDPEPVAWGLAHNFEDVPDHGARATIHLKDVREPSHRRPDIRTSPNFSWMIFTERPTMLEYFRGVREDLADDGIFVLDIYGGPEAFEEMEETRKVAPGFTYVWDQKSYHPATGAYHCRIHFRFKDGSSLNNVFDYHWRLWTLPEVVDILRDAGFTDVETWWEGTDEDGVSGNGVFKRHAKGENCPAWVTYIIAKK